MKNFKHLRRLAALLMALMMVLALAACGTSSDGEAQDPPDTVGENDADSAPAGDSQQDEDISDAGDEGQTGGEADPGTTQPGGLVELDIDGENTVTLDGKDAALSMEVRDYNLYLTLNGNEIDLEYAEHLVSAYLVYLQDGSVGLMLDVDMASDDFCTYGLSYENGSFSQLFILDGRIYEISPDSFVLDSRMDCLGTRSGVQSFEIQNGFEIRGDGIYRLFAYTEENLPAAELPDADPVTTAVEMTFRTEDDGEKKIPAGTSLVPLETDRESWVSLRMEDGTVVIATITPGEEYGININGVWEPDAFSDLLYAG